MVNLVRGVPVNKLNNVAEYLIYNLEDVKNKSYNEMVEDVNKRLKEARLFGRDNIRGIQLRSNEYRIIIYSLDWFFGNKDKTLAIMNDMTSVIYVNDYAACIPYNVYDGQTLEIPAFITKVYISTEHHRSTDKEVTLNIKILGEPRFVRIQGDDFNGIITCNGSSLYSMNINIKQVTDIDKIDDSGYRMSKFRLIGNYDKTVLVIGNKEIVQSASTVMPGISNDRLRKLDCWEYIKGFMQYNTANIKTLTIDNDTNNVEIVFSDAFNEAANTATVEASKIQSLLELYNQSMRDKFLSSARDCRILTPNHRGNGQWK